jgi:3-dehydroquinate dehydratase I
MSRSFLASRLSLIQRRPLVVGTLVGGRSLVPQIKIASSSLVDIVEVRLDTFDVIYASPLRSLPASVAIVKHIKRSTRKPILLTIRSPSERGERVSASGNITDKKRAAFLRSTVPLCELVDLELRHRRFTHEMTKFAHARGANVIHSIHDFSGARRFSYYSKFSEESRRQKGDIFKVAVNPKSNDQLEDFLNWGINLKNPHKVLIGMGAAGLFSRSIAYCFGSILTYGHLGVPAAPGQIQAGQLGELIQKLYA